jgi:hypothetical protein
MPDYSDILTFLATNPPELQSERAMHASLLELLASCLRAPGDIDDNVATKTAEVMASQRAA